MFKIKNGQLIMYDILEKYKQYLRNFDSKVSLKENRKFYGILVTNDNIDYYVPFTSKVKKNTNSKLTINIKEKDTTIAKLLLNNMIPVNECDSVIVDINNEKYKEYYNKEILYLRKNNVEQEIIKKINKMYEILGDENNRDYSFFKKICCNFPLLVEKCIEYNRVQKILPKLKYIEAEEDLFYIYDSLENKNLFEKCTLLLDKEKNELKNIDINSIEDKVYENLF